MDALPCLIISRLFSRISERLWTSVHIALPFNPLHWLPGRKSYSVGCHSFHCVGNVAVCLTQTLIDLVNDSLFTPSDG